jgi:hypothetical protein
VLPSIETGPLYTTEPPGVTEEKLVTPPGLTALYTTGPPELTDETLLIPPGPRLLYTTGTPGTATIEASSPVPWSVDLYTTGLATVTEVKME